MNRNLLHRFRPLAGGGMLLAALAAGLGASAQDMPSATAVSQEQPNPEPTPTPENPAGYSSTGRNPTSVFLGTTSSPSTALGAAPEAPQPSPLEWGPVILDPHPSYGISYTDGILVAPGDAVGTTRQSLSPGFLLRLGPNWTLDYTPTWEDYSNALFHDGFDQAARLQGVADLEDWNLQFTQDFSSTYDPLLETGRQTREDSYSTGLNAVYHYASHTLLELGVSQDIQISPVSPDAYEWSTLDWLHHELGPQWDAAIGGGFSYIVMNPGFDMAAVRPEGRLTWQTTKKLTLDGQAGVEHRTFIGSGGTVLDTFIFSGTAAYQIWDSTKLTASANRDVEPGYAINQVDRVTKYSVGLEQRLLRHFFFDAEAGQETIDYIQVGGGPLQEVRGDDATTGQLSLNTVLFSRLSLGLQYSRVRDDSDVPGFNFTSNQYGFTAQYRY